MISLNFLSNGKSYILASTLPSNNTNKPSIPKSSQRLPQNQQQKQNVKQIQKQPSVAEIEKAIGAGVFRDRDPQREEKTLFDTIMLNSLGKKESSVEKKLRETGEWILDRTERNSRSAGKQILVFVFVWILPMWIFALLVASGVVRLPFSTPVLDDLIL